VNEKGLTASLKNLFIEDMSTNGKYTGNDADVRVLADSVKVYEDNVVFDYSHGHVNIYIGKWDSFFITNCKFRNAVDPITWTMGAVLRASVSVNSPTDSVVMKYNTFFCLNGYVVSPGYPLHYVDFSHNTIAFTFLQPFMIFSAYSAKINNNIFYAVSVAGETKAEYPTWDEYFSAATPAVISFDTMDVRSDSVFDPSDAGQSNWRMLAEAKRTVQVDNNAFFEPKAVTDFWTAWDDTAKGSDSLYTPNWMNARTQNMFSNKSVWPGFEDNGNILGIDPGYGSSLSGILTGGSAYGLGLFPYFQLIRTQQSPTTEWGYQLQTIPSSGSATWVPYWPLPEASDMQYTNAAVKTSSTDGLPLGDPYWFDGLTGVKQQPHPVANKFYLSNNYPNPFNPSTTIKIALVRSGVISLKIYNVLGQLVKVVAYGYKAPGAYFYDVNMDNLASGVYFYRLEEGTNFMTKKMVLLK
jgi:hypothetical protein